MNTNNWWEERFERLFNIEPSGKTKSGFKVECDPIFVKDFISSVVLETEKRVAELERIRCEEVLKDVEEELINVMIAAFLKRGKDNNILWTAKDIVEVLEKIKNSKIN